MKNDKKNSGRVMWFINDTCNYHCSYCMSRAKAASADSRVAGYKKHIEGIMKHIPRGWNIFLLGGGEPFLHPDFLRIVGSLAAAGYRISVNTNFSRSDGIIEDFFRAAGANLYYFKISLHLEHKDPDSIIKKIDYFRKKYPYFNNWHVVSVALPARLAVLQSAAEKFRKKGIRFGLQHFRDKNNKHYGYSPAERVLIRRINGCSSLESSAEIADNVKGSICSTGCRSILLKPSGDIYRCIPYSHSGRSLGNITRGDFSLLKRPEPCDEASCYCGEKF